MKIVVLKFGGTSVADVTHIKKIALKIKLEVELGYKVITVVSAMSGVTNNLINLVKNTSDIPPYSEYDTVLSTGEQVTSALLAIALDKLGVKARSWLGWQIPIVTDKTYGKSIIEKIKTENILNDLEVNQVAIVSGFQGVSSDNRITTLGRGGSDTTAVALAAKLGALRCDIYTDVDGVFSADPKIVKEAKKINKINYEEMLELSSLGAKVLHTRSVQLALKYNVPLQVLSSFTGKKGTMLTKQNNNLEQQIIRGIAHSSNEALITLIGIKNKPGISALIFNALSDEGISVDMIVQSGSTADSTVTYAFTVAKSDASKSKNIMGALEKELKYTNVLINKSICKVSIVGLGMKTNAGVANKMFSELAKNNINIHVISTSEIKISVLIDDKYKELAIRSLHATFKLTNIKKND